MSVIITVLKIILFLISFFGFGELIRRKSGVNPVFIPALTVCTQISLLFAAGLLNVLLPAALIIYAAGIVSAIYWTVKDKKSFFDAVCTPATAFLLLGFAVITAFLWGKDFFDYDNFSHWALVIKTLLLNNRFPNFMDPVITFQEYPLGSSVFIWFFSRMVSEAEYIQAAAQQFMVLCFFLPLFKYIKKSNVLLTAALLLLTNFILCYNIVIEDLLVDTLIPLQGGASILFILSECFGKERKVTSLWTIPFTVAAVQIKNSGVFFAAIVCLILIVQAFYHKEDFKTCAIAAAAPVLSFLLWHAHCKYVFVSAFFTRHAMTTNMMLYTFRSKSAEDIRFFVTEVFRQGFSGADLLGMLLFMCIVGAIALMCGTDKKKIIKCFAAFVLIYAVYIVSLLLMYLFSMPYEGEQQLAAFDRYRATILIMLYYLGFAFALRSVSAAAGRKGTVFALALIAAVCIVWGMRGCPNIFKHYSGIERIPLQTSVDSADIPAESDCLIIIPEADDGYTVYLARYLLYSSKVQVLPLEDVSPESYDGHEYIIAVGDVVRDALGMNEYVLKNEVD